MTSPAARVRADLQARTGIDFAGYADDEFVDAVTGWSGLLALGKELAVAVGAGLLVLVVASVWVLAADLGFDEGVGLVLGGLVAGAGVTACLFALRVRRRAPSEAAKVFEVAATMADRVAADAASGRLQISASDAARGVAIVAAVPALTRATQRRFPVVGLLFAPAVGAVLSRALLRVWPSGQGTALVGLEHPARRLEHTLEATRGAVMPKVTRAVRWATLPLLAAGVVLIVMGVTLALVSLAAN